jgi:hypothetical protein
MTTPGKYLLTLAVSALSVISLTGCTIAPVYQLPESSKATAYLSFEYTENNFSLNPTNFGKQFSLSSVGKVLRIDGPVICGEPLKNPQKLFVRNHGNPLVSELNKNGIRVEAEKKLIFDATSIPNLKNVCGRVASFTPKVGAKYVIHLDQSEGVGCSVAVNELIGNQNNESTRVPVADFQLEPCLPTAK